MQSTPDQLQRRPRVDDQIRLVDLWRVVWDGKILIVGLTGFFTVISIAYALLATEWYRADALLMPVENESLSDIQNQLSGLAAIAGIRSASGGNDSTEAIAVLRSRDFARDFITELGLKSTFMVDQDEVDRKPDMRDAVRFFHDNVLRVSEDTETGLVTLSVEWTDAETAAKWANLLVQRLNERMRSEALRDAEANIRFLRSEMKSNTFAVLQQSIAGIMEGEMQKLMLARGYEEYAFHVIDSAVPPQVRSRPKRTLIVATVFVLGGALSVLIVFLRSAVRSQASD